jgi:hypothetical protein
MIIEKKTNTQHEHSRDGQLPVSTILLGQNKHVAQ